MILYFFFAILSNFPHFYYLYIRNEKTRRYLCYMRKKYPIPFTQKFPGIDPMALHLLERLLAFDTKDRPTAAEVVAKSKKQ